MSSQLREPFVGLFLESWPDSAGTCSVGPWPEVPRVGDLIQLPPLDTREEAPDRNESAGQDVPRDVDLVVTRVRWKPARPTLAAPTRFMGCAWGPGMRVDVFVAIAAERPGGRVPVEDRRGGGDDGPMG